MATSSVRIQLRSAGVRELLRSGDVESYLVGRGRAIAAAAGPGHEVQPWVGRNRARVTVRTATYEARKAEAVDHALTKAIGAGRA